MIHADRIRLVDLFCSVFEFARFTGTTNVTVGFHEGVIEICTDGRELTPEEVERAFEYGEAIPRQKRGCSYRVSRQLLLSTGGRSALTKSTKVEFAFTSLPANSSTNSVNTHSSAVGCFIHFLPGKNATSTEQNLSNSQILSSMLLNFSNTTSRYKRRVFIRPTETVTCGPV